MAKPKDIDFDEDWVAEAQSSLQNPAESEFKRYKLKLKKDAGLLDSPLKKRAKSLLARLMRFCGRTRSQ